MALYLGNKKICPVIKGKDWKDTVKTLIEGNISDVILPSIATSIRQSAFYVSTSSSSQNFKTATLIKLEGEGIKEVGRTTVIGQTNLTTIKLPNCTKIGYQGLMVNNNSSNSLSDITLGALEEIADYGLQRVFLNSNQTRSYSFNNCAIGSNAFDGNSFEELDLTGVKSLGQSSFYNNNGNLRKVWMPSTIETIVSSNNFAYATFSNVASDCTIYTDVASVDEVPSTWGVGWKYSRGTEINVVYGATHEQYKEV